MTNRKTQIGFSQRIRLEWFEQTVNLVLAGNDKTAVKNSLQALLENKVSVGSQAVRGNREKIITILLKTWLTVPCELEALRDDGLEMLARLSRDERIALHWGMSMAAYPFWGAVAAHTGRLLRLQGTTSVAQVQRRVREQYGERSTVSRATQRVLRSFIDWGVLEDTHNTGVYAPGRLYQIQDRKLMAWLVEASLYAHANGTASLKDLLTSPTLFPFQLGYLAVEQVASLSPRLDILRHGLDDDLVMIRDDKQRATNAIAK